MPFEINDIGYHEWQRYVQYYSRLLLYDMGSNTSISLPWYIFFIFQPFSIRFHKF